VGRLTGAVPGKRAPIDRVIAELASRQHGVVATRQLRERGVPTDAVLERHRLGRLHRLHRGVYAVGHLAPSAERDWMAAVIAVGDGAVLSHRSAAELWRLLPPMRGPVEVSLGGRAGRRRRSGIRVHRPLSLPRHETTKRRRIPVTSPARTLTDLRTVTSASEVRDATRRAGVLGLASGPDPAPDPTRSELERRFLWLCHRHRLPRPAVNRRVGPFLVDFCWSERRLIVETDGYRYHRGRAAFEEDRDRDLKLRALGFEVLRLSHRQLYGEPEQVASILRETLRRGAR
jgi:very-short-patch-repair endonuclease